MMMKRNTTLNEFLHNKILFVIFAAYSLSLFVNCNNKSSINNQISTIIEDASKAYFERGVLINGKKEGYWVTIDSNMVLIREEFYKDDKGNGQVIIYSKGLKAIEGTLKNDKAHGKWIYYSAFPNIETEAQWDNGKEIGEWRLYTKEGKLNKILKFENDTFKVILDNRLE